MCSSEQKENPEFLSSQILTYIGNKRALISDIEKEIIEIKKSLGQEKLKCADLFSGSGIVSRMLKQHSSLLIANDQEKYSCLINSCYLSNKSCIDWERYSSYRKILDDSFAQKKTEGIITKNYAPKDDTDIKPKERAFYTRQNALTIDTYRNLIDKLVDDKEYRKFFLAPLLVEASIHVNTSGVFKGFYKNDKGIGCYGGTGKNALSRILGPVELKKPVLSNFECDTKVFQKDAVLLSKELEELDVVYLDPPYNQHPYGSNYFMLNLILKNKIDGVLSRVSGIVSNWNRSAFNKKASALSSMETIIASLAARYIIISYNSEGFISFDEMSEMLKKYGSLKTVEINYNTFRGSRNLKDRNIHVSEYLFVLKKNK